MALPLTADITSTAAGGNWSDGSTWLGGSVPGSADNAIINGPVYVNYNAACNNLTVNNAGTLSNYSSASYPLAVFGSLLNNGHIINNAISNYFVVYLSGNLVNNNTFTPNSLFFSGSSDQYLTNNGTFNLAILEDTNSASCLILQTDIALSGTAINLHGAYLVLNDIVTSDLSLDGGNLQNANILGGNGATLTMSGGSYLANTAIDEIVFAGTVQIAAGVSVATLINNGTLCNYQASYYNLEVGQRLENHGVIQNSPISNMLLITLKGSLWDYGVINIYQMTLANNTQREIFLAPTAAPIIVNYLDSQSASGDYLARSDLRFQSTNINFFGHTLILSFMGASYNLSLVGGLLNGAVLDGGDTSVLNMSADARLVNVSMDSFVWQGVILLAENVSIGRLENYAVVRNFQNSFYTFSVTQKLINRGTIENNPVSNHLFLNLSGDLEDYGTLAIYQINLVNSALVTLYQAPAASQITCAYFNSSGSAANYQALSDLRFSGCEINLYGKTLFLEHEGQSCNLFLNGGYLYWAVLDGGESSILAMSGGSRLTNVTIDDMIWQGDVLVAENVIVGNLDNYAVVHNFQNSTYTLVITHNLHNYGTIANNPVSNQLLVNLAGDLFNYGVISNYQFYLNSTAPVSLFQDEAAAPFSCQYLSSAGTAVTYQLLSSLSCVNCYVNFAHCGVVTHYGDHSFDLNVSGCYFINAILDTDPETDLTMGSGAFMVNVTTDEIAFHNEVLVTENVSLGSLTNYAVLRNYPASTYSLTVRGDLLNCGVIENSPVSNVLLLNLGGSLDDRGVLSIHQLVLNNPGEVTLAQSPAASPISCSFISSTGSTGSYRLLSDLRFVNSNINFNNLPVQLEAEDAGYDIAVDGGYLVGAVMDGCAESVLNLANNAYLQYITADEITFNGIVSLGVAVAVGKLYNLGTLRNFQNSTYTLYVNELLANHGSITDNPISNNLQIVLSGDLYDYGAVSISLMQLPNPGECLLYQSPEATPIRCANFNSYTNTGSYRLLSDLRFVNSVLNFNNRALYMYNGRGVFGLETDGGYLCNVYLNTDGFGYLKQDNGAYLQNVHAGDIILKGSVQITNDCFFDDVVNYGTLQNFLNSYYLLTCHSSFVNYGVVRNNPIANQLYLHCAKDFTNYGTIQCQEVRLNGSQNQYLLNPGTIAVGSFLLVSEIGGAQWYYNGTLPDPTWMTFKPINPNIPGVWQPVAGSVQGRYITIGGGAVTLGQPQDITAYFTQGELKMQWNQVSGAIYYNIYAADLPDGPFDTLLGKAFDPDLSDGIVRIDLAGVAPRRFYQVTAGN